MPRFHWRLGQLVTNTAAWVLDYWYVGYWQLHSFFIRQNPAAFRRTGTTGQPSILLIPGIYENWRFMRPVAQMLYDQGYDVHVVEMLGYNVGNVEAMAAVVTRYVAEQKPAQWVIVAHSKGGLVGKQALITDVSGRLRGMVAINTPFNGSRYARYIPLKSVRIFMPTSPVLSALTTNAIVNKAIVSIYGTFDPHIPGGSRLEGAENVKLETRGHFRVLKNDAVHQALLVGIKKFS
jgi:triacylglycerol lipase